MKFALLLLPFLLAGCVERLISVRSDPSGASVLLDGEPAGTTPVDIPYTWYGTREVTLELRGYRSVSRMVPLAAPWWQYLPFDFITDVLLPLRITDRTELHFLMETEPTGPADIDALKARADELRKKTQK